jgi:hypothetical protein
MPVNIEPGVRRCAVTIDGQPPLLLPEVCPVTLDEVLAKFE